MPAVMYVKRLEIWRRGGTHVDRTCDGLITAPAGPSYLQFIDTPQGRDLNCVPQVVNNGKMLTA